MRSRICLLLCGRQRFLLAPGFGQMRAAVFARAAPGFQPLDELITDRVVAAFGSRHH